MADEIASDWDASAAVGALPVGGWSGQVLRCHARKYAGDDAGGSLLTTGRYHRGSDRHPDDAWPALYTSLAQHVALGEHCRHTTPANLRNLANQRISRLRVHLQAVLDVCAPGGCTELGVAEVRLPDLCHPSDYAVGHAIASAARALDARIEGILVPSCTRFPEGNLIVFVDRLCHGSGIAVEESVDPDLFVDLDAVEYGR